MEIIQAQKEHLQEIININNFVNYWNPDSFIEESIHNWYVQIVIQDKKVLGFSLYQIMWGNTVFLALLKVHPEYQWKGIWTKLIDEFENTIRNKYSSYCSSTEEKNILSQKFHDKLWLQKIGILDMPHGKEVFYRKELKKLS